MANEPTETTELRLLADAAMAGPWTACGNDRGGCSCGFVFSKPADTPVAKVTIGAWGDQWPEVRQVEGKNPRRWGHPPDPPSVILEAYMARSDYGEIPEKTGKANAAFIAAVDPTTVIGLLNEIDRLRARVAELEKSM
jgi:hypothetical protein